MEKISVCIITKNEEIKIEKCLKALNSFGFGPGQDAGEIIVADTGSDDSTITVARKYADIVTSYKWNDDFAAAKNHAISLANNRYVLIIDSDEYMTACSFDSISSFINEQKSEQKNALETRHEYAIGRIKRKNYICPNGISGIQYDYTERLFDKELFGFEGCIHEQVVPKNKSIKSFSYRTIDISIDHDGYNLSDEELKSKSDRNCRLLESALKKDPDNPYIYFQLGQSYLLCKSFDKALSYFSKALEYDLDPSAEYVQMAVTGYGECLLALEMNTDALSLADIYEEMSPYADYVFLMGQIYMANNMILQAYKEFLKCLSMSDARSEGVTSYYALHNIGVLNEMTGNKKAALPFYEKAAAMGYQRSIDRLRELTD